MNGKPLKKIEGVKKNVKMKKWSDRINEIRWISSNNQPWEQGTRSQNGKGKKMFLILSIYWFYLLNQWISSFFLFVLVASSSYKPPVTILRKLLSCFLIDIYNWTFLVPSLEQPPIIIIVFCPTEHSNLFKLDFSKNTKTT